MKNEKIEIQETKDHPLLEKLARERGQEVENEITKRIVKSWFAFKRGEVVGGIGIFKWNGSFVLDYSFVTEDKRLVREKLLRQALLFVQKKGINKIYYIRGAPEHLFPIRRFGFREIHWRDLPPVYRDFSLSICDKCPAEKKSTCNPIAMVRETWQVTQVSFLKEYASSH